MKKGKSNKSKTMMAVMMPKGAPKRGKTIMLPPIPLGPTGPTGPSPVPTLNAPGPGGPAVMGPIPAGPPPGYIHPVRRRGGQVINGMP